MARRILEEDSLLVFRPSLGCMKERISKSYVFRTQLDEIWPLLHFFERPVFATGENGAVLVEQTLTGATGCATGAATAGA